jgi:hypothetical protein
MPRKYRWQETVEDWPPLEPHRKYPMRIHSITKGNDIDVLLEFCETDQAGRTFAMSLLRPIHPTNLAGRLFSAAGLRVAVGERLFPQEAIGKVIGVTFEHTPTGPTIVEIEPAGEEENNP